MTPATRTSCLAQHLVRAASKPMRSPRGVTLASVQLSSLPDVSSSASLPQQHERGNRRLRVLPLQSQCTTLRGHMSLVYCMPCPNTHLTQRDSCFLQRSTSATGTDPEVPSPPPQDPPHHPHQVIGRALRKIMRATLTVWIFLVG